MIHHLVQHTIIILAKKLKNMTHHQNFKNVIKINA